VRLNPEQRAAVEHGDGPLLIVAGAGTGKTRVLVERVGYLLRSVSGLQPSQILALTFANKAADEMRQRAAERFGEQGRQCRFSTFHAFCYELLARSGPSRVLDAVDQWIFLRRRLEELELEHYFKVSEPGRYLADLVSFSSRCHDNLVMPEEYSAYVERLRVDCARRQEPITAIEESELARQGEVARVFALLERMQKEQGLLSFGSMISRAVSLLDSSPKLLADVQRKYQYLLVDEFQDTNTAQFELLALLAGTRKNLTVVGDDDQAIYRFRGASFASFQQFTDRYPEHVRVVLNRNYRSTKNILAVAGSAIANNSQDRYMPDKKLVAEGETGAAVELWEFAEDGDQAEYLAQHIEETVASGQARNYSEFAVLYRAHDHRKRLVEALRRRGVPFDIKNLAISHMAVIRDVTAVLRLIGDTSDSVSLVRVLADPRWADPRWDVEPDGIASLCREAVKQKKSLWEILAETDKADDWKRRGEFIEFRRRFRAKAESGRLLSWLPLLYSAMGVPRTSEERTALATFTGFVARWDSEKSSTGSLAEFLEYMQYFEEAGGVITLDGGETPDLGVVDGGTGQQEFVWDSPEGRPSGKVQLMTVHAAKGLEFDRVFVWHLVGRAFPTSHRRPLIELPPALWKGPLPQGDFHIEEERRLFYVALTRARHSLVLSTVSSPKQRPSMFAQELQDVPPPTMLRKRPILVSDSVQAAAPESAATNGGSAGAQLSEWFARPTPKPRPELSLSASQLRTYLECPLQYHLRHDWRVPVPQAPPMLFGIIVHGALRDVMASAAQQKGELPEERIREVFELHWRSGDFRDKVQERKYKELGLQQVEGAAREWSGKGIVLLYQERPFDIRIGGCKLVGRMDQLHRLPGGGIELVEYKTGRPYTQREVDRSLQITLYAQACRQELGVEPSALTLYNLTTQEAVGTRRTERDYHDLERTIREAAQGIAAGAFPAQPGYHCRFCSYRAICPAQEERIPGT
jgi:DNA helicase-2/ATP-dependent DNA helicase PcrA